MLWGVEFVADPTTKAPFPPPADVGRRVGDAAFERGVILYPGHGGADGTAGDHLLVAPPFVIMAEEIAQVAEVLGQAVAVATVSLSEPVE
jgi:adenosylmethionine-8-amino-7-oxononanoate aminotransferase